MINITTGANTGQRKQLTQDKNACLNSKRHQILMRKNFNFQNRKISQPKQEAQKSLNISTTPSPKQEHSQTTTESTTQQTKVTTPPSTNTPQPMQSTKSDTPQSPTIKQAQTDMTPKYEDLRAYYTKPSFEFEKQFGFMLKPWTTVRFMNVIPNRFIYKIALVGKDEKNIKMDLTIISMYLSF